MKKNSITLLLFLLFINGFSQNSWNEFKGRLVPSVKKEKLKEVQFVSDITPELWQRLRLSDKERIKLDNRRKEEYSFGCYLYPQGGYEQLISYIAVEISATCNGKVKTGEITSDKLCTEQKNILTTADLNSELSIKIKFIYKSNEKENAESDNTFIEGELEVKVVPETEAEFPGGFNQLTEYLAVNIFNKVTEKSASEKLGQAMVKFTINEEGKIVDANLFRKSADDKTDKLVLDAINKMPIWKPAKNSQGEKVKQKFSIPFGNGGC